MCESYNGKGLIGDVDRETRPLLLWPETVVPFPEEIVIPACLERRATKESVVKKTKKLSEYDLVVLPLFSAWMSGFVLESCAKEKGLPFPAKLCLGGTSEIIGNFEDESGIMLEEYHNRITKEFLFPLRANGDPKILTFYSWLEREAVKEGSLVNKGINKIAQKAAEVGTKEIAVVDESGLGITLGMLVPFMVRKAVSVQKLEVIRVFQAGWLGDVLVETLEKAGIGWGDIGSFEKGILINAIRGGIQVGGEPRDLSESDLQGTRFDAESLKNLHQKIVEKLKEYGKALALDNSLWI